MMASFLSFETKDQGALYKLFFDYSYERNFIGAIVFYIVMLITMFAYILVGGKIIDLISETYSATYPRLIAIFLVMLGVTLNSFMLLNAKKLFKDWYALAIIFIGLAITWFFGFPAGLIPLAYLSMSAPKQ